MRAVWLAFFCLIGLAITAVIKLGMSPYASADFPRPGGLFPKADLSQKIVHPAEVAASSDDKTIATNIQNTSAKGDKLEASDTGEASAEAVSVKPVLMAPAETEPKPKRPENTLRIVSRHWHDPLDKRSVPAAAQPSAKRKLANASINRPRIVRTGAPKS